MSDVSLRSEDIRIVGERVILRCPNIDDAEEYLDAAIRSRDHLQPWVYLPESRSGFDRLLERTTGDQHVLSLVCAREDQAIVGAVNLNNVTRANLLSCAVGYYSFEPYAGQGYLREALPLAVRHAFRDLELHRVEANIQPGNWRSIELARRSGFRLEGFSTNYLMVGGHWCDHERWAITTERLD